MFIWEWVLGWFGTGVFIEFDKLGTVARTNYNRASCITSTRLPTTRTRSRYEQL